MYDLIIAGGGPAGMSAAIYAARYGLSVLLLEKTAVGGQMNLTATIENYPGFEEPISGYVLSTKMLAQVEHLGVEVKYSEIINIELEDKIKRVTTEDGIFEGKTIILAMGASPKKLGIKGENTFLGRGVSYCGTCDGPLYKGKVVASIGGGDTALEEAIILAQNAKKVYLIHRRDQFRGQKFLVDQVQKTKNIEIHYSKIPKEINGSKLVESITLVSTKDGKEEKIDVDGVFVFIGYKPNTDFLKGKIDLDENGFILTKNNVETNLEGVFAAGDIISKSMKQIVLAAADGAFASFLAFQYLQKEKMNQ